MQNFQAQITAMYPEGQKPAEFICDFFGLTAQYQGKGQKLKVTVMCEHYSFINALHYTTQQKTYNNV